MNPKQIRKHFLEFFANNGHQIVKSSPVIPAQDPTLLFTNAGMNQFKDLFLGTESRSYKRAATAQKCVRAGGKHNDLDQVGFTKRHLTFFEMLGNFSFGDYFKKEAIRFAWDFLTKDLKIDPAKLSATVHLSDDESEKIWMEEIGLPKNKITRKGDVDNFWQMGDTGPCGPCSEIFFDRGEQFDFQGEDERFIEIWNMVFMQYNRQGDGALKLLAQPGVDTGMGFERLVTVLEGAESIFDTAVFAPVRSAIEAVAGAKYQDCNLKTKAAYNVLCDHIRSSSFIIADGGKPSNDGRGYVLRKIIRRALLFAKKLSPNKGFFASLVPVFVDQLGEVYPELVEHQALIFKVLTDETERFFANLEKGERIFENYLQEPQTKLAAKISGLQAFKLYDTYGFPLEITRLMALDAGFEVDIEDFEKYMEEQRQKSGANKKSKVVLKLPEGLIGKFVGYDLLAVQSKINWMQATECANEVWLSTEQSPFFAARGGQISDTGLVLAGSDSFEVLQVQMVATSATTKAVVILVKGEPEKLALGQVVLLQVDARKRLDTAKNHSATHLLHTALRKVLGDHAKQAGSVVEVDYLRFDFNHDKALTLEEIRAVEILVNDWVQQAVGCKIFNTSMDEAIALGADAIFGEKYNPESVRVVDFTGLSTELCGGTHLKHTGEIGCFKIISEESVGIGVRRIVALTGSKAIELFVRCYADLKKISEKYACKFEDILPAATKIADKVQLQEKELASLKINLAKSKIVHLTQNFKNIGLIKFLITKIDVEFAANLKDLCEFLLAESSNALVFFVCPLNADGKFAFVGGAGKALEGKINFASLIKEFAALGIKCGGQGLFIQGGGVQKDFEKIKADIEKIITIFFS